MKKRYLILSLAIFLGVSGMSQELSIEEAVKIALIKNHNVLVQKNQAEIVNNGATIGNAGLLPKVDVNGSVSAGKSVTDIQFVTDPVPQENLESESKNIALNAKLSYTLFDGLGNINTYRKLTEQGDLADVQAKLNIESTIMQVINGYYEVLRHQNQLEIYKRSIEISRDRLKRVELNQSYGSAKKIDVLNAQVDFNTDSTLVLTTTQSLKNAKYNLNYLLGRAVDMDFSINTEVEFDADLNKQILRNKVAQNNTALLLTQSQLNISELDMKIQQSRYWPILSGSLSYGYTDQESTPSVILFSNSLGLTGTLTLAWNLFDGNKKSIALENARIGIESNHLLREQSVLSLNKEFENFYGLYENNKAIIELEKENLKVAQLNLERSEQLLRQGQITNLEFRQAQLNLLNSETKLNNAKYSAKITEYQLKRLAGEIIQ